MSIQSITEISREGLMRGIVVDNHDPQLEGRVALHVPKMVTKYDPKKVVTQSRKQSINTDLVQNDDFRDLIATDIETVNYIWFRPIFQNGFLVPYVGQTVHCIFEDGDPSKPYYYPFNATLNGEVIPMSKLKASADKYDADKKPLVHVLAEFKDGTIIYHDENRDNKRLALTFQSNHSISINENPKENSIELITESGHVLVLDQKNKHITIRTARGHMFKLDDVSTEITATTFGGKVKMVMRDSDGNLEITNTGKTIVNTTGDIEATTEGNLTATVKGDTSIKSDGAMNLKSKGSAVIESAAGITMKAPSIKMVKG